MPLFTPSIQQGALSEPLSAVGRLKILHRISSSLNRDLKQHTLPIPSLAAAASAKDEIASGFTNVGSGPTRPPRWLLAVAEMEIGL